MKYDICDITFFAIAETQIPRDLTLRPNDLKYNDLKSNDLKYKKDTELSRGKNKMSFSNFQSALGAN